MKNVLSLPAIILLSSWALSAQPTITDTKKAIIASVEKHRGALIDISDKIWAHAETAFEETQSAKLISYCAEKQVFSSEHGVFEIPTAFLARFGSGSPAFSILGEFDALQLHTNGVNFYREHVKPTFRMRYHIQDGGQVINVVPDYTRLWMRIRNTQRKEMMPVYEQLKRIAAGAAIMANVDYKVSLISGIYEILVNRKWGEIMQHNLELLGAIA